MARLTWLGVPGAPDKWRALGFDLAGKTFVLDGVVFTADEPELAWGFDELESDASALGVPTRQITPDETGPSAHPGGVNGIDHIVYRVAVLDDGVETIEKVLGLRLRRRFHPRGPSGPEMAFFRAGAAVIEVVETGQPPAFSGIAFKSGELDETVAAIRAAGGSISDPKPAVQGGRIASVWTGHTGMPIAIMQPAQRGAPSS